ncbi:type II toxin-antitoxin system PemK/MazF family toxin [Agrilactobacillus fermenti]|uniref:type II toxin-antitoxin system PemK/MazF family toxin n=1 Tax=Agrilactobacillus fermenti TaxID=2586909 RepID=UPI001E35EF86|nr:type II toxin-antitoxin system PemK/MazF family toxin [Agrilactobacillus fermenti]MCD2257437.1 type II toxin-antitoxin system PemK/MazF family toxin [Agrilactobacillus fermenti]
MRLPQQKDIVIIDAEPHSGKEYGGHALKSGNIRRHMVVMSSNSYTRATGMILAMPITTSDRYVNNPHYLPILVSGGRKDGVKGYIALWQLQNFDFVSRHGEIVNQISDKAYKSLLPYVKDMLGL